MSKSVLNCLIIILFLSCITAQLPNYIEKCRVGNKECLFKNINSVFSHSFDGDTNFILEPIDPIYLGTLDIQQDAASAVQINLKFTNSNLYGAHDMRVVKSKGFGNLPEGRHDLLLKAAKMVLKGDYTVNGKVLILPVQGVGKFNLTFDDAHVKIGIIGKSIEKNGKIHMDVIGTELFFDVEHAKYYFGNLFNGDKALGENVNIFINDNWREIFNELRPGFTKALNDHLFVVIKAVFANTPYSDMFEVLNKNTND